MSWLRHWLGRGITIQLSLPPLDGSKDRCLRCSTERRYHSKDHKFVEKGKS